MRLARVIQMSLEPVDQPRTLHDLAHEQHPRIGCQTIRARFDTHRSIEGRADARLLRGNSGCSASPTGCPPWCSVKGDRRSASSFRIYTREAPKYSCFSNSP